MAALWALAIVQPLLSLLGSNPDFFVARDNTGAQIIVFVLLLTLLPPIVATAIEALVNLIDARARWFVHLGLCGLLFATIALQVLKRLADGPGWPMILVALILGGLLAWAYAKARFMRSMADILTVAPLVILISFLFFSDASELTFSTTEVQAKEVTASNPAPVVMVIFDEFPVGSLMTPDGDVNRRRFPNFGELERTGTWYRNTATDASYTAIAVPSILTGQPADRDGLPTAADHPDSIFTLLGGQWRTRAVEPITQLCPEDICGERIDAGTGMGDALRSLAEDLRYVSAHQVLPKSMEDGLPDISQSFEGFGGHSDESVERGRARQWVRDRLDDADSSLDGEGDVAEFLGDLDPDAGQTFDFVHVEEPHYPWTHYPSGLKYSDGTEDFRHFVDETTWHAPPYMTNRAHQAHLLEAGFADNLLGRILTALKKDGRFDDSLIVVTADHGGTMTPGLHRREANPETMGEIGMVPLFIKAPHQKAGRVVSRPTCTTETVPEMARILGIDLPWKPAECDRGTVRIDNGTGPVVTLPFAETIAQRDAYVDHMAALFGGDTGWDDVLKLGPFKSLIGRPAAAVPVEPIPASRIHSETPEPAASGFDPGVEFNPVLRQRGKIDLPPGLPLAVTVNDRIAAVGQTYADQGQTMYSILLPEWALKRGDNAIRLGILRPARVNRLTTP
ncbi:MAG: sulfatase-like hydrolase/transferase [Solirubrobacterales bacterium]|nr:sulfatase-like hydrolase/transferase [Solirubrobacterales bacterium]